MNDEVNWLNLVYELQPGQVIPLTPWILLGQWVYFWDAGKTRVTVHYGFAPRGDNNQPFSSPQTEGPMKGVPAFSLRASVEVQVLPPPLELSIRLKRGLACHEGTSLSEFLEGVITNRSNAPVTLRAPGRGGSQMFFEGQGWFQVDREAWDPVVLQPGQSWSLFSPSASGGFLAGKAISVDAIERRTYAILQDAYQDREGRLAAVRSNEFVLKAVDR